MHKIEYRVKDVYNWYFKQVLLTKTEKKMMNWPSFSWLNAVIFKVIFSQDVRTGMSSDRMQFNYTYPSYSLHAEKQIIFMKKPIKRPDWI